MQRLMMLQNAVFFAIANPNGFEKTECEGKKLKNIAPNVSAMSSGGFGTTHYQNTTMTIESTEQQLPTTPAITYSEC